MTVEHVNMRQVISKQTVQLHVVDVAAFQEVLILRIALASLSSRGVLATQIDRRGWRNRGRARIMMRSRPQRADPYIARLLLSTLISSLSIPAQHLSQIKLIHHG